jgi:two-component system sensor histidine kinase KdpD
LLENAVRSSPQAGVITFELSRNGDMVELRVTDRGPRFSAAYRARIFDTYVQQADDTVRRARKGRGLGLASCRSIAQAHNGRIWLEDAQPEGSLFCVVMPIGPRLSRRVAEV